MSKDKENKKKNGRVVRNLVRFRSSIYGRVVIILSFSLIVVFVLFNIIFRSIYTGFYNRTISRSGDNISSVINGSLYYSMLENDKSSLKRTMDMISSMSGVDEVNLYDADNGLAFSSVHRDESCHCNPNCLNCHGDLEELFGSNETSYMVLGDVPECGIHQHVSGIRHLVIREPILNESSCYTAACHAHSREEEVLGSLIITMPLDDLDEFSMTSSRDFMMLATLVIILVTVFLAIFSRKRIKEPIENITRASRAVSLGDTSIRLEPEPGMLDDIRMVSEAFNNMLDHIESATSELQNWSQQLEYKVQKKSEELSDAQEELIHVERIASLGKLSSSVAHEINNPLSGILVYNKLIQKQLGNEEFHHPKKDSIIKNLKLIESETKRCGDIVKGLLDFSRKEREDFEAIQLHQVLEESFRLMMHSFKVAGIRFDLDLSAAKDRVVCSPNQIKQACVAILVNASEAVQDQGEILLRTYNPDEAHITIAFQDNGSGIAEADLDRIFEPFYSTKRSTSGIGLGLSIVHGIIENHKGKIEVQTELEKGTIIEIILPLSEV